MVVDQDAAVFGYNGDPIGMGCNRNGLRTVRQSDLRWQQGRVRRRWHAGDKQADDGYDTHDHGDHQHDDQPFQKCERRRQAFGFGSFVHGDALRRR